MAAHTVTDSATWRLLLAETRRTKVAISRREVTANANSVAAPVFGNHNEVIAAVSVVLDADTGPPLGARSSQPWSPRP